MQAVHRGSCGGWPRKSGRGEPWGLIQTGDKADAVGHPGEAGQGQRKKIMI